ncbi:MAG: class I SAM-dependent methyltransferase, partial [Lamprocystis purpurea]|nr:class I SAM-dependent methyltransferase [Lamprocystis purpurea]
MGFTTRLFLENIDTDGKIVTTIDLPSVSDVFFQGHDEELARKSLCSEREYLCSAKSEQVEQILIDSMKFETAGYEEKFDFVFVDANHKLEYVKQDTENAFKMLTSNGCIAWHDYGNPQFPELKQYLKDLSVDKPIYHVEETMLCFYLP